MTEVQARTIPQLLAGRDVLAAAKTGQHSNKQRGCRAITLSTLSQSITEDLSALDALPSVACREHRLGHLRGCCKHSAMMLAA